jgi:hypothetical protein
MKTASRLASDLDFELILLPGPAREQRSSYIQTEQVRVPVFGVSPSSAVPSAHATSKLKLASRVLRGGAERVHDSVHQRRRRRETDRHTRAGTDSAGGKTTEAAAEKQQRRRVPGYDADASAAGGRLLCFRCVAGEAWWCAASVASTRLFWSRICRSSACRTYPLRCVTK